MGFTATMFRAGESIRSPIRSSSAVFHAIEGRGSSRVNGQTFSWGPADTFSAPVFADLEHSAQEDAFLIRIHDAPLQKNLGFYEERPRP
jgi:gentisate 1,2-dioxygenase